MTQFKAVLFDWEGVIGPQDSRPFGWLMDRLPREYSVTIEAATEALLHNVGDFLVAKVDNETFWQRVGQELNVEFSQEWMDTIWGDWHGKVVIPEMRELVEYTKARGLKAVVLSNTFPTSAEQIRKGRGYDMFDAEILSCNLNSMKPDEPIYHAAIEAAGCAPEECIFIDDVEKNLAPARALGITTILATDTEQIIRDLKALIG